MNHHIHIDKEKKMVQILIGPTLSNLDVIALLNRRNSHPDFSPHLNEMMDFRNCHSMDLNYKGLNALAKNEPCAQAIKRAFLVLKDGNIILQIQMLENIQKDYPYSLKIFHDENTALKWLSE